MKKCIFLFLVVWASNLVACNNPISIAEKDQIKHIVEEQKDIEKAENAIDDSETMIIEETDIHEEKETTESDREFEEGKNRSNGFTEVTIERIDRSVYDEEGRLIAIMYYDKPVISGDSEAVHKINTYFQNESEAFFGNGHSVTWFSNDACREFENGLELMQECWGNETMAKYPCRYAMDTRISYLDDDLISIMQIRNYSLEQNSWFCYGSTFDLKTGELLPITELVSLSPEELRKIMSDISYNDAGCYDDLRKENYVIDFYGHIIDMQYEYFFDGKYYYIINDFGEAFKTSTVIKWNGKWGDEYEVSAFQYSIDRENEKIIRYKTCEKEEEKSNDVPEITIERIDKSIINEKGQVLGIVYYEKPVVSGDSEAVRKINAFYEREEQEWFDGYGRNTLYIDGYYSYFYDQLKDLCEQYGEEYIAQYPLQYTIKTRIMFFDEKLLSVVQIANICTGHNNCHSYGSTFDLETGELVSLDELADIDADQLKMIIDDVLSENNIYGELGGDNYVIHHYAYEAAMNYEYYYDGEKFYIILNYIEGSGDGGIVVWNGKWGEEYAVEEFGYFVQPDGETLEKIAW